MSKQLLHHLNGENNGPFRKLIERFEDEPRIAWYPSSGEDFRELLYLHPNFSKLNPAHEEEPDAPDFFLHTDYFPWQNSSFLDTKTIYNDHRTTITVEEIEHLPNLDLALNEEIVSLKPSIATNKAVFLKLKVQCDQLETFTRNVVYAFGENEAFYCNKLIPNNARITHVIHVRYGGGCGGGGNASGAWLVNVLSKLNCEAFITDNAHHWQAGDHAALELCPHIPRTNSSKFTPVRTLPSVKWSGYGDVTWYNVDH